MEPDKIKQEPSRFFKQRETASAQLVGKWANYRHWLKQSLKGELQFRPDEINNSPYLRGGICSYNTYLSGMLRAHLWGLWLTAVAVILFYFGLGMLGLRSHLIPGLPTMLLVAAFGSFHWALICFIGLEKRLRAMGMAQKKSWTLAVGGVGITTVGLMIGWFIRFKRDGLARHPPEIFDWLMSRYDWLSIPGSVMIYVGLALILLLPCYRNSDTLPVDVKGDLSKVKGYPTPLLLLFHLLLLFPAVAILA